MYASQTHYTGREEALASRHFADQGILGIISGRNSRRRTFQVNCLDRTAQFSALVDEVTEILPRDLALASDLERLLALDTQMLYGALQSNT